MMVACVVVLLSMAFAARAEAQVVAFVTPGKAAYCGADHFEGRLFGCWTPNDGFSVSMTIRGAVEKEYDERAKGHHGYPGRVLGFGQTWRDGRKRFTCTSLATGLTCRNRRGHGWWLGRFSGYRLF